MRKPGLIFMSCILAGACVAASKPNILLIYSDDHGWADLGAQGVDREIRTPNLDQLARDGVRCARGYVSAPQCVPSRAGVLTGRYQQKFGVEDNKKGPLPLAELTLAERLRPAGYVSGQVGKWHLDGGEEEKGAAARRKSVDHLPHTQGFDEYWCGSKGQYHASHDLRGQPFADAPRLVKDDRFRVVVQTEAALSFLDRRATTPDQPWFLYLAWFAPHVPLESPEPWFSSTSAQLPLQRRQALAMIAAMDDGLGRIREKLRAMGVEKDTLIFFIGDNGAPLRPGAWNGSINLPLIGEKGMLTDGGIRTPFVVAWPGTLPSGRIYDRPVSSLDVACTAVASAGQPRDDHLDGVNLVPFLTGDDKAAPHDRLYWRWRSQAAVLEFPWKLIRLGEKERFLFDVTTPEGETKNRLAERPDIAERLEAALETWTNTLRPPGFPEGNNDQDNLFFAEHVEKSIAQAAKRRTNARKKDEPSGSVQGWLCRNGTLTQAKGALVMTPDASARSTPFLTHSALDLPGPLTVTLRIRGRQGGRCGLAWRTVEQSDFVPENTSAFDWPSSGEWREVKAAIPAKGRLVHLRIVPGKDCAGLEIQSIELRASDGKKQGWNFETTP